MPVYLSSRAGKNLRVGVRLSKRRKSDMGLSTGLFVMFSIAVLFVVTTFWWPYILTLFIGTIAIGTGIKMVKIQTAKRAVTAHWGHAVEQILHSLKDRHNTTPARQRRECDQAIELLKQIKQADPHETVIKNSTELISTLQSIKKTTPLLAPLKRAELAEFKGKTKQVLSACLDLLFLCETEQITNQDLRRSDLHFNRSGKSLSIGLLREKCRSLGWGTHVQSSCKNMEIRFNSSRVPIIHQVS